MDTIHKIKLKRLELYKSKLMCIDFMKGQIDNIPDIFDVNNLKCKLFLIKCFSVLDPSFHYLTLLGTESVDEELIKVGCILQIYPFNPKCKDSILFRDMNEEDIHKFWMRFFKLCELQNNVLEAYPVSSGYIGCNEFDSFQDVDEANQYMNYKITTVNAQDLTEEEVNKEIESWLNIMESPAKNSMGKLDPVQGNADTLSYEKLPVVENVDMQKLSCDVRYISKKFDHLNLIDNNTSTGFDDYFSDYNDAVKKIREFRNNLSTITSLTTGKINFNITGFSEHAWLLHSDFIKRCNDMIELIKTK